MSDIVYIFPPLFNSIQMSFNMLCITYSRYLKLNYFSLYPNIYYKDNKTIYKEQSELIANASIDTIRSEVTLARERKVSKKLNKDWQEVKPYSKLSANLKKQLKRKETNKQAKPNKASSIKHIKYSDESNNLHSHIILKSRQDLNIESNYKKKELSINGLSQPNAPVFKNDYKPINEVFSGVAVSSIDISVDFQGCIETFDASVLENICDEKWFEKVGKTLYLNKPHLEGISKICIYDKGYKDDLDYNLTRVEFTCKLDNKRINEFQLPILQIKEFMSKAFGVNNISIDEFEKQIKYLTDKRSFNKRRVVA